ncbi:hypothetical protein ACLK1T_01210 [Escherichia coli]
MGWRARWRRTERRLLLAGAYSVYTAREQWAWMIIGSGGDARATGLPGVVVLVFGWHYNRAQARRHKGVILVVYLALREFTCSRQQ